MRLRTGRMTPLTTLLLITTTFPIVLARYSIQGEQTMASPGSSYPMGQNSMGQIPGGDPAQSFGQQLDKVSGMPPSAASSPTPSPPPTKSDIVQVGSSKIYQTTERIPLDPSEGHPWESSRVRTMAEDAATTARDQAKKPGIIGKLAHAVGESICTARQGLRTLSYFRPHWGNSTANSAPGPKTAAAMFTSYQTTFWDIANSQAPLSALAPVAMVPGGVTGLPSKPLHQLRSIGMIMRYAQYSALSYCSVNATKGMSGLRVPGVPGEGTLLGDFEIARWVDVLDLRYFIAVNHRQRGIVLGFRGSVNKGNYHRDANSTLLTPDPRFFPGAPNGAMIHGGMQDGIQQLFDEDRETHVGRALEAVVAKNPSYAVVVTGHSLGGAIAVLTAHTLSLRPLPRVRIEAVLTYGQPIIGNAPFGDWMALSLPSARYARVVSSDDIVPYFTYNGWYHVEDPTKLMRHPKAVDEVYFPQWKAPVLQTCNGVADPLCSENQRCGSRYWDHHSWYGGQRIGKDFCRISTTPDVNVTTVDPEDEGFAHPPNPIMGAPIL